MKTGKYVIVTAEFVVPYDAADFSDDEWIAVKDSKLEKSAIQDVRYHYLTRDGRETATLTAQLRNEE